MVDYCAEDANGDIVAGCCAFDFGVDVRREQRD
jgi:hypothetical protein